MASRGSSSTSSSTRSSATRSAGPSTRFRSRPRHPGADMTNDEIRAFLQQAIDENPVMLFMKGTPEQPACGFSMRTAGALNSLGVRYAALDILPDPRIRQELSAISNWPTIPQLFVNGKLVGGCDIVTEMYESGELAQTLGLEVQSPVEEAPQAAAVDSAPLSIENRL